MKSENSGAKKLILSSVIYSFSGLLIKCFSFFLMPLYTIYLTTSDYGVMNLSSSFLNTMGFIVTLSLFSAVMRFYVDLKDDTVKLKRFYGTVILFTNVAGILWTVLLFVLRNPISKYVFSNTEFFPLVFVSVISIIFHCQHNIYDNILKSQQRAAKSSILNLIYFFVSVCFNLIFVVGFKLGALGAMLATLLALVLYTMYFVFDMLRTRSVIWCIDAELLKSALKYSIPIIPHNLSTQITTLISQILIGGTSTLADVGVYSIAAHFGGIADTVQSYVNQAYGPWLYENLHEKNENYKSTIRNMVKMLTMVIVLMMLGITLFAEDYVLLFLHNSYNDVCKYVPLVVLTYVLKIPYYFYINILFYYKKAARLIFIATVSGSLVNVLLSAVFIPLYGVYGSIFADWISMFIRVAIVIVISKYADDIGIKLRDFMIGLGVYLFFAIAGILPSMLNFDGVFHIERFVYKVILIIVYVAFLMLLYREQVKGIVLRILKKWRQRGGVK